ncbi:MAG: nucleotidyltransferase domain-containing protein [Bacteroidetes bacterium]|nr:nucleotidyltransferase domain-containing protein [Bacteroidota bacterium]
MIAAQKKTETAADDKAIIRTLLYFDIFDYPLATEEITRFLPIELNSSIEDNLSSLVRLKKIFRCGKFYSIQDKPSLADRRIKGNLLAEKKIKTAKKYSRLVSFFPFVRAIMLSGSISKGFMDEKSDIDYFIITEKNRLWIVRTLLALFRRLVLFNSHKNLCTNYFVDTDNLEIHEKNVFTAIECCTLVPMYGQSVIENFQRSNSWLLNYQPHLEVKPMQTVIKEKKLKLLFERFISTLPLDRLNQWLRKRILNHWMKKYKNNMIDFDFEIAFRSTAGVSKSHPQFFQKKVLSLLNKKIIRFEKEHDMDLSL